MLPSTPHNPLRVLRPALLFDLDGTLVDTIDLIVRSARHAFAQRPGPTPTDAEWIALIGTPLTSQLRRYASSEDDFQLLVASYRGYQREHHDRMTRCYDGALETVRTLRQAGHRTAVVTSKMDELAWRALRLVGLDAYMDVMVGADQTTRHKPDPEPVALALELLGVDPGDALFVGDSPHDIAAGNAAGVATVAALWGPFSREALDVAEPSCVIDDIRDLYRIVRNWEVVAPAGGRWPLSGDRST